MIPPASPLLDMISALLFGSENLILLGSFVDSQHPVVPLGKCDLLTNDKSPSRKLHQLLKVL